MSTFQGTGVALVTPFTKAGEIDYTGLENVLQHTAQGVDYWVVQGTTGEASVITPEDKAEILRFTIGHNPKQLPIVFGIGGNDTRVVVNAVKTVDLTGVDAVLSVAPYYNKPTDEGFVRHFTAVADASPKPIILYNVPGRTAKNMSAEAILRLAEHPNIIAVKEASGDIEQGMEIARHQPEGFQLISGDDLLTVALMSVGAVGVISVLANLLPVTFQTMVHSALKGDFVAARQAAYKLLKINPLMYQESNPVGVKAAMDMLDICEPWVRLPLIEASPALTQRIKAVMTQEGLKS
ncbi:MAG TPA: 4-hydroxy-tetrahydrodipicolinate synthase [Cytophagales bacterium]|nr:4-hydroxy-tetrahydrodipicolinate synthase [Cytophagales bacterium]HAP59027.1 4-hydroxy-tetrahydrodipicolinate synthase [Cytophagales bacterium]